VDIVNVENFIREVCSRLAKEYDGFHTIGTGKLDGEGCPEVLVHVKDAPFIFAMVVGKDRPLFTLGKIRPLPTPI
jgi:hypothetical protein